MNKHEDKDPEAEIEGELVEKPLLTKRGKVALVALVATLIGVAWIVINKNPSTDGPTVILTFLGLCFLFFMSCITLTLTILERNFKRFKYSALRIFYTSILWALGCVFLLGLQTLRQLQLFDVVLVIVFELLINFYLLRRF